jgi:hypothetical protein
VCFRVYSWFTLPMKSAYELAMERLAKSDPDASRPVTPEQKGRLADEVEKIQKQLANERARINEEREEAKERVRRAP